MHLHLRSLRYQIIIWIHDKREATRPIIHVNRFEGKKERNVDKGIAVRDNRKKNFHAGKFAAAAAMAGRRIKTSSSALG